jgi:hypothetical protein
LTDLKKEFDINRESKGEAAALFSLIVAAYSIGYQNGETIATKNRAKG